MMRTERISPHGIEIEGRFRSTVDAGAVERLMESIRSIGLQTPISVRYVPDSDGDLYPVLVAGRHRLEACRRLGIEFVDCFVHEDERSARLWEIAENLHRADLTALERSQHIAEWVRLTEEKVVSAQVAPKPRGGRPEGGINAATRDLGIDRTEAQRAVKVDSLSDAAKAAAVETGLADNRTALLDAAKLPQDKQEAAIRDYRPHQKLVAPAPSPLNDIETEEQWITAIMRVWNRGAQGWREEFIRRIETPVFDNTRASMSR